MIVSIEAMQASFRLHASHKIDGTALAVMNYFAYRHSEKEDAAFPSLKRICDDLDIHRGRACDAIKRLEAAKLVIVKRGRAGGRSSRYYLPWVQVHRLDPRSDTKIDWPPPEWSGPPDHSKRSGPADHSDNDERSGGGRPKGRVGPSIKVRPTRPENSKTIKQAANTAPGIRQNDNPDRLMALKTLGLTP